MPDDFRFDVFLSHSSKDKPVVRGVRGTDTMATTSNTFVIIWRATF